VLGFSLPIVNLFLPYVLVVSLWRRLAVPYAAIQTDCRSPSYFKIWWFSHLVVFLGIPAIYLAVVISMNKGGLELALFVLSGVGYLLICNTARYAIRLVREIDFLQD
jgi:hypothetical protein